VWAATYDRRADDVLAVEAAVSSAIASEVETAILRKQTPPVAATSGTVQPH
jgi:hypothetical protein